MMTYIRIRDYVIKILFKFHKISTHSIFLPSFGIIWLESEKIFEKFVSDHVFSQALPINWLPQQQWIIYPQTFNFDRWPIYCS